MYIEETVRVLEQEVDKLTQELDDLKKICDKYEDFLDNIYYGYCVICTRETKKGRVKCTKCLKAK